MILRVGIDVGGTFTDLAATDAASGKTVRIKVPSTPRNPELAVLDALDKLAARDIAFLGHSTTIATNALLGQIGLELPRVAMVTTHGFRDVIEIGRQNRSEVYNLFVERPKPLVRREDRLTVVERIGPNGEVVTPLDDASLDAAIASLRQRPGIAAVAVCFLNAYANDAHERRAVAAIRAALPDAIVSRSSEIDPEYREYERFSTTVVNAVLAPIVQRYLDGLVDGVRARKIDAPLYVMRSDGGLARAEYVSSLPAAIVESGPASGAIAAADLGTQLNVSRLLAFDMGGTTAKAGTIVEGVAQVAGEFEAAGSTHSGRSIKGSGYPVRFPFVDLAEVSAGGGTIAWIDDGGALHAGPLSAGADPGPACYGRSDRATVTDANVVLGRLNQTHLLGGAFAIDAARSRAAIATLAEKLGLSVEETARGIVTIVDAQMAKVLRIVTVERGLDPRTFSLVAFGGGGPLHACALAAELGIARAIVPEHPGIFSAIGLLVADLRVELVRDASSGAASFEELEAAARARLREQGAADASIVVERRCDARYRGQSFELTIPHHPDGEEIARRFHAEHRARYGYDVPDEPVEVVNVRLSATAKLPREVPVSSRAQSLSSRAQSLSSRAQSLSSRAQSRDDVPLGSRKIWIDGAFGEVPVYRREAIAAGTEFDGPAIVEQYDTTTYVAPGWHLRSEPRCLLLTKVSER